MNYKPETKFTISNDYGLVYNLRHHGWRKGQETFENDVAVHVEARHLPLEVRALIAVVIRDALNTHLFNQKTEVPDVRGLSDEQLSELPVFSLPNVQAQR